MAKCGASSTTNRSEDSRTTCANAVHPCNDNKHKATEEGFAGVLVHFSKPNSLHGSSPQQSAAGRPKGGPQSCGSDVQSHPAAGMYLQRYHPLCSPAKKRTQVCFWPYLHASATSGLLSVCSRYVSALLPSLVFTCKETHPSFALGHIYMLDQCQDLLVCVCAAGAGLISAASLVICCEHAN